MDFLLLLLPLLLYPGVRGQGHPAQGSLSPRAYMGPLPKVLDGFDLTVVAVGVVYLSNLTLNMFEMDFQYYIEAHA